MLLDEILDEWDRDADIDEVNLDKSALGAAKIHAKYLRYYTSYRAKKTALQIEYDTMRQIRFRYYRGELTQAELKEYQWDQWQGVKPLKNEAGELLNGDSYLNKIKAKIEYTTIILDTLQAILKEINGRNWMIKNAIQWKLFIAGE